jgi:hypothetical protein
MLCCNTVYYTYRHTCVRTYIYTYIHTYTYIQTHIQHAYRKHTYINTYMHTFNSLGMQACILKCKAIPVQAYYRPRGFQEFEAPRFRDSRHMKLVRSALRTGRLYPPRRKYFLYSFLLQAQHTYID